MRDFTRVRITVRDSDYDATPQANVRSVAELPSSLLDTMAGEGVVKVRRYLADGHSVDYEWLETRCSECGGTRELKCEACGHEAPWMTLTRDGVQCAGCAYRQPRSCSCPDGFKEGI